MRLLHVIGSMEPQTGGPCQGIRNLAPRSLAQGHTVEVVCLDEPQAEYLTREDLPIHALGKGRSAWRYHPNLRRWLEINLPRFDAVILNGLWLYPGYLLSELSTRPGTPPYFVFPHGMLDPWFQRAPERRLKAIRNWFYWKLIERHVISRAEAIFFTCAEEMRLAAETFRPYRPKHAINVGYGVTQPPDYHDGMAVAFRKTCPALNDRPFFLFLGRIDPKKGIALLIKAYAQRVNSETQNLKPETQKSQGSNFSSSISRLDADASGLRFQLSSFPSLVIAGPGLDTAYGWQMQKLAADLCPPGSVHWPGMLSGDAKWGSLFQAEAFVLPSHQENFGIAVVESLACGTPVLISKQVNIWREIIDDHAGIVAADTQAGTEQLFREWKNFSAEQKSAMKQAARQSYQNRFGIAMASQNLLLKLGELVQQRAVARS